MQLTRLEIKGFKSFGDKITINFNEGVTAIVGPNGCGKSNISDMRRLKDVRSMKISRSMWNRSGKLMKTDELSTNLIRNVLIRNSIDILKRAAELIKE